MPPAPTSGMTAIAVTPDTGSPSGLATSASIASSTSNGTQVITTWEGIPNPKNGDSFTVEGNAADGGARAFFFEDSSATYMSVLACQTLCYTGDSATSL